MKRAARIERRNRIVLAYAIALGNDFANPAPPATALRAVRAAMPDTSTQEIADAIRWAIRASKRKGAKFERAVAEWQERWRDAEKAAQQHDDYDPDDDFSASINEAYAAIRARVAAGGKGWTPR